MAPTFSLDNQVFKDFVFFAAILGGKCLLMSIFTAKNRILHKVFPSAEDYASLGKPSKPDPNAVAQIERTRNAHRNDMENIFPFLSLGFVYCFCNPNPVTALWLFRMFTAARIGHTIVYLNHIRQPFRAIFFTIGLVVNFSLCGLILKEALRY